MCFCAGARVIKIYCLLHEMGELDDEEDERLKTQFAIKPAKKEKKNCRKHKYTFSFLQLSFGKLNGGFFFPNSQEPLVLPHYSS